MINIDMTVTDKPLHKAVTKRDVVHTDSPLAILVQVYIQPIRES
jgi:hypothetical protein